jgi:hypothetical protein
MATYEPYGKVPNRVSKLLKVGMDARCVCIYLLIQEERYNHYKDANNLPPADINSKYVKLSTADIAKYLGMSPKSKHTILSLLRDMEERAIISTTLKSADNKKYRYVKILINC